MRDEIDPSIPASPLKMSDKKSERNMFAHSASKPGNALDTQC